MKKKIVSFVLALVMVVLALVGCGAPQLDEINFSDYATFNLAEFKEALAKLEIKDGTFTNDEDYRQILVSEDIYEAVRKVIVNKDEKKYAGKLDGYDSLYYRYYISANVQVAGANTKDDTSDDKYEVKIFDFDMMAPTTSATSTTSNNQVINLGSVSSRDDDFKFMNALKEALLAAMADKNVEDYIYETSKPTEVKVDEYNPITVIVSFTREWKETTSDGETTNKQTASYVELVLDKKSDNALVQAILKDNESFKIGSDIQVLVPKKDDDGNVITNNNGTPDVTDDDYAETESSAKFEVKEGDITYTYSAVKVQWIVDKKASEDGIVFKYTLDGEKSKKEYPYGIYDSNDADAAQFELKGMEVEYHVFPVYYYDVPDLTNDAANYGVIARALLELVLGTGLAADSYEVFESEEFLNYFGDGKDAEDAESKNDMTVKALVAQLVEVYKLYKDDKGKEQHKWGDASESLLKIASVQLLKKIVNNAFALTDADKAVFSQTVVDLFADLEKFDAIRQQGLDSYKNLAADSAEKKAIDDKAAEAVALIKAIYDSGADKVYGDYLTIKYDDVKNYFELIDERDALQAEVDALDAEIKALEAELKTLEGEGDSADDVEKARIAEIKVLLNGVTDSTAKTALENEIKALNKNIEKYESELAYLEGKGDAAIDAEKARITELKDLIEKAESDVESKTDKKNGKKATLDTDKILLAKLKTNVETERTNFAGAYTVSALKTNLADKVVDDLITDILACEKTTVTTDDAGTETTVTETIVEAIVKEKRQSVYDSMDTTYRNEIYESVVKAVWQLIKDSVKVVSYPEEILKEYADHIYEEYEYKFYKESTGGQSNYSLHGGDFEKYLKSTLKADDYMKAIETEAKGYLEDLIKLYTVADAFEKAGAQAELAQFIEADIAAGAYDYDLYYKYDSEKSDSENKEAKDYYEEYASETKKTLRENAKYFYMDDEAYNEVFKKHQGSAYNEIAESYGERNLRACLQFNNLMDYLTSYKCDVDKDEQTVKALSEYITETVENTDDEGNTTTETVKYWEIQFHNSLISYTIK